MINLIKNEFKKIFKKKNIYIVTVIFILYCLLTNVIYKNINTLMTYEEPVNIEELKLENNTLDLTNKEDIETYISNLTLIETEELKAKYSSSNQKYLINNYLYEEIYDAYEAKYLNEDEELYLNLKNEIDLETDYLKKDNWQYFVNLKIDNLKESRENTQDEITQNRLENLIKLNEYRLTNKVAYDASYLDNAIEEIEINLLEYTNLQNRTDLNKNELARYNNLKEQMALNKYILENKQDLNNNETLRAVLINFPSEFGLFILIYLIMISGSIVSEEFNKGTIKFLLTKPYKRKTILLSKLLTVLLSIPLIVIFMVLIEFLVGGLLLGFDSLSIPVVLYSSASGLLKSYPIISYLGLLLLTTLPIYLVLAILCFTLSTLTNSTSAAITITFLFYLVGNVISNLALSYNYPLFKAFISLHWDFSYLINFSPNPYGFKPLISLLVVLGYLGIMLILAFLNFQKKDVKNI